MLNTMRLCVLRLFDCPLIWLCFYANQGLPMCWISIILHHIWKHALIIFSFLCTSLSVSSTLRLEIPDFCHGSIKYWWKYFNSHVQYFTIFTNFVVFALMKLGQEWHFTETLKMANGNIYHFFSFKSSYI